MTNWKEEWKRNINNIEELDNRLIGKELNTIKGVADRHPMSITPYYYGLIDMDDPNDPIRKLSVPGLIETDEMGDYDTSGEATNTKFEGVQHKYKQTMLVLTTNACFMYCRHCFRKRLVGTTSDEITKTIDKTIGYLKEHKEVNNVLLSGGDSFALSNSQIREYVDRLSEIEHLDFIRFGTRAPVVFPERVLDNELLDILEEGNKKKQIFIVTHFNHEKEITPESTKAIKALLERGIPVGNQTVLLKDVNDDSKKLASLINKLTSIGVTPYYVFQCRPVKYVKSSFQVPLSKAYDIVESAKKMMNGHGKRFKFAMSHPRGKIEIAAKADGKMIFKFHQAKYDEDASRVFIRDIDENGKWLDDELNFID